MEGSIEELHNDLDYLLTNGRTFDLDSVLTSCDDFDGVIVVTSDDRRAELVRVRRMSIGCAGTCNSTSVSYTSSIIPLSMPMPGLYDNLKRVRLAVDSWLKSFSSKGKQPPKAKINLANFMIEDMANHEDIYQEMLEDGIAEYMSSNLGCDIAFFKGI